MFLMATLRQNYFGSFFIPARITFIGFKWTHQTEITILLQFSRQGVLDVCQQLFPLYLVSFSPHSRLFFQRYPCKERRFISRFVEFPVRRVRLSIFWHRKPLRYIIRKSFDLVGWLCTYSGRIKLPHTAIKWKAIYILVSNYVAIKHKSLISMREIGDIDTLHYHCTV